MISSLNQHLRLGFLPKKQNNKMSNQNSITEYIDKLKVDMVHYKAVYILNFKKKVHLEEIIKSPFYHRYQFVCIDGISATAAMILHGSLPKKLVELELKKFRGEIGNLIHNLPNLQRLRVNKNCELVLKPGCLPKNLQSCTWNCGQKLEKGILTEGLVSLDVDYYQHQEIQIPNSVEKLRFGIHFNLDANLSKLPSKLKILVLENLVYIDNYPTTLQKVVYGCKIDMVMKSMHYNRSKFNSKIKIVCMKEHPKFLLYGVI